MGVHTGFWLSWTRSAIVPAIQTAGCLPFSSKCQVKHTLVDQESQLLVFVFEALSHFQIISGEGASLCNTVRASPQMAKLLESPLRIGTRRKQGPIGSYRPCREVSVR